MGVAIVVIEVTRFVAPVSKGDVAWANANSGAATAAIRQSMARHACALPTNNVRFIEGSPLLSVVANRRESQGRSMQRSAAG